MPLLLLNSLQSKISKHEVSSVASALNFSIFFHPIFAFHISVNSSNPTSMFPVHTSSFSLSSYCARRCERARTTRRHQKREGKRFQLRYISSHAWSHTQTIFLCDLAQSLEDAARRVVFGSLSTWKDNSSHP